MFFDVLLRCFHVFGDDLRGLQRRFSCFRCLLRFRFCQGIFFGGCFLRLCLGFEGCFKGVQGSFLSLSCFLLTGNTNSLDHWDTCIVTLGQECFLRVFFKVVLGLLRVFLGCLWFFLKVFPVLSSLDTPLVRTTVTLVMGNQFLLAQGCFFLVVLKVFEGDFRVFRRCFYMAYLPRVVKIRFGNIRFW